MSALTDALPKAAHTATIWTFDIERAPGIAYAWAAKNHSGWTPEHMQIQEPRMISFAAKRQDGLVVFSSEFHHGRKAMLDSIWAILNSADILVGYNSKRFDIKHISSELVTDGYPAPMPSKHIDLMQTVKRRFGFNYNNLGSVTRRLGVESKLDNSGFELWKRCMADDPEAWAEMRAYNIQDVHATDALRTRIQSWIPAHPNVGLFAGDREVCPSCGSAAFSPSGSVVAATTRYSAYRCDSCGSLFRSAHREASVKLRPVVV